MYDVIMFLLLALAAIYGLVLAVKPALFIKKEWKDRPEKQRTQRLLGIIILVGSIAVIVMKVTGA